MAYFRFSPLLATDIELDETDDKVLIDLMWHTMAYVHSKREDVMSLKELLVHPDQEQPEKKEDAVEEKMEL